MREGWEEGEGGGGERIKELTIYLRWSQNIKTEKYLTTAIKMYYVIILYIICCVSLSNILLNSGAVESGKKDKCSPKQSLDAKPFSQGYL